MTDTATLEAPASDTPPEPGTPRNSTSLITSLIVVCAVLFVVAFVSVFAGLKFLQDYDQLAERVDSHLRGERLTSEQYKGLVDHTLPLMTVEELKPGQRLCVVTTSPGGEIRARAYEVQRRPFMLETSYRTETGSYTTGPKPVVEVRSTDKDMHVPVLSLLIFADDLFSKRDNVRLDNCTSLG